METSLTWLERLVASPTSDDWRQLLDVYGPLIERWVTRSGVDASDRDDLVQEVLMVVARRIPDFQHLRPGAFRSWLRTILAFQLKRYFSKLPLKTRSFPIDQICVDDSQIARLYDREHDEHWVRFVLKLTEPDFEPKTWRTFQLCVIENLPTRQVAESMGMSINAVLKSKARVLKRIRQELHHFLDETNYYFEDCDR